jgi:hypothetical protein
MCCGIGIEVHYCMGKKAGMEFYGSTTEKCGKCGMTEKNTGCCHDEHQFYKLSDWHQTVANDINFTAPEIEIGSIVHSLYYWQLTVIDAVAATNHPPPLYAGTPARIMHGVFRI